jgi:hypothetical protein
MDFNVREFIMYKYPETYQEIFDNVSDTWIDILYKNTSYNIAKVNEELVFSVEGIGEVRLGKNSYVMFNFTIVDVFETNMVLVVNDKNTNKDISCYFTSSLTVSKYLSPMY